MKKRLLSMLMAVLMIVSLVPAVSADYAHANCDVLTVSVKADAAAKQPAVEFAYCNTCDKVVKDLKVTAFAEKADIQKCAALGHNWKTVELQAADCSKVTISYTYCADCGTYKDKSYATKNADGCIYNDFTVVVEPTCTKDGWGYAVCKNCNNPVFVKNASDAVNKLTANDNKVTNAQTAAVKALFAATGHVDTDAYVTVSETVYNANGTVKYIAAVEPTHVATVKWNGKSSIQSSELKVWKAVVSTANDNVTFKQVFADSTHGNGKGATGDAYCPDCGVIMVPSKAVVTDAESLNLSHAGSMTVKAAGYYPYADAAGKHDGRTDLVWCDICKAYFGGDVLPYDEYCDPNDTANLLVGQTFVIPQVDATCRADGHTAVVLTWTANKQWAITTESEVIPMTAHHYAKLADVEATCTEKGYVYDNVYACDNVLVKADGTTYVCGAMMKGTNDKNQVKEIPAACKMEVKVVVEPTCSTKGLSVKCCSVCGAYAEVKNVPEVYTVPVVACTAADELANVKEATCTETGYTGDKVCKWCGDVLVKGEATEALGHTEEAVEAVAATCTEAGLTAGTKCSVCGEVIVAQEEVPALGHTFDKGVCTVCGAEDPDYVAPVAPEFTDAKDIAPYAGDAVAWAVANGIVNGRDDGSFDPKANVTRAEVVTMLYRLAGEPEVDVADVEFVDAEDVPDFATKAVAWAAMNGVVEGYEDGTFKPMANITRAEFVQMLYKMGGSVKAEAVADFSDVVAGEWYVDAINWAVENEVTTGRDNGTFGVADNATREEAVTFLFRAFAE